MSRRLSQHVAASALWLLFAAATAAAAPEGVQLPEYREFRLDNGALLVLMERRDVPLVSFNASMHGGVIAEPDMLNGVAALTAELLEKGSGMRNAREFAETVAAVGGVIEVSSGLESIVVSGEFMSRDAELMTDLLADMLRAPALENAEFEKVKLRAIQSVSAARDSDPRGLISTYANAFVFGDHHYGRSYNGSESSLERIGHEDVLQFYADNFGADRLQLTIVGDFDSAAMKAKLERRLGDWQPAKSAAPRVAAPAAARGGRIYLVDKPDATQTYFWIGNIGVSHGDPDTAAIDLVNTLFGGRFTSMLNTALRVESGLTYGARSTLARHTQPGTVAMISYTANETTIEAIDMALSLLDKLRAEGIDETDLQSGKSYRKGLFPLGFETNSQLAAALGRLKFYAQPDTTVNDYTRQIDAVSDESARAVIARVYPAPEDLVFVVIGKAADIREDLAKYGAITETPISAPRFTP
ncbi:MAG: pitrilysin family protein [Chromatiales bacterium]|jgi:predicted Zn-dependent peptidase